VTIGVVHSETTRQALLDNALRSGETYGSRFLEPDERWVVGHAAYLAPAGAESVLRRLGLPSRRLSDADLERRAFDGLAGILLADATSLPQAAIDGVATALDAGMWVLSCGPTCLPPEIVGATRAPRSGSDPRYVALDDPSGLPIPCPERAWVPVDPMTEVVGTGRPLGSEGASRPVALVRGRCVTIATALFSFVGEVQQGHADAASLHAHLGVRALTYLDEVAAFVERLLERTVGPLGPRVTAWGDADAAIVLRHDTDDSDDPTFLDVERERGVPATYAVLQDDHWRSWLRRLESADLEIEAALHYRTNRTDRLTHLFARGEWRPDRGAIAGDGIVRQMDKARRAGLVARTLHRHGKFFYYPETIDALDRAAQAFDGLLGSGSLFRFDAVRYAEDRRFATRDVVRHPHTPVPLWTLFRPQLATTRRHRPVGLWEGTHLLEPEPAVVDTLVEHARRLPGGLYTLGFHPAHARRDSFRPGGTLAWFEHALSRTAEAGWRPQTYAAACERLSGWEALELRLAADGHDLRNTSSHPVRGIGIRHGGARWTVELIGPGEAVRLVPPGPG